MKPLLRDLNGEAVGRRPLLMRKAGDICRNTGQCEPGDKDFVALCTKPKLAGRR